MAVVKNLYAVKQSGKLGGVVYYQAGGETRSRELAAKVTNPRTDAQMSQRVRWSNLVNLYRANRSWMKYAFENKAKNQSDYNKFMSLNVANSPIFLPKGIAAAGGAVVSSYAITAGSLPSIETVEQGGDWKTNVYLSAASIISDTATIAEVATDLLAMNPALQEGDQLSFIRMTQLTNTSTGAPYVVVRKYEVLLKTNDRRKWSDFMPTDYIVGAADSQTAFIQVQNSGLAGGFVLILSRTTGGRTFVSSQSIIVANNSAMIAAYSGPDALERAISSYGSSEEPFLTSTSANGAPSAEVPISPLTAFIGTTVYTPGENYLFPENAAGLQFGVNFNQPLEGEEVSGVLILDNNGTEVTATATATISGSQIVSTFGTDANQLAGMQIKRIVVTIDGVTYTLAYRVINQGAGGDDSVED